ncbi:peptide/nickel transport system ATP-binding protein [Caldanaerobius fijiensis DSM 17918]|uniref:Peptide/nickel transport system ATP-binding protein n=1 Tax=Caldanaerobius fijiensis DSM 17918 TaxID=1121256 RepID=A0A1M4WHS0_9THEO|nr:ABC transporter ATP-binding protein [Caldanaerobius fijiensis]SHE80851.1 peptide/nickel transport system ATP-binding protein [Caldanaerobius fijiensis DSM 17918]
MNPIIELKNVSMIFEKRSGIFGPVSHIGAVVDVSLEVYPGEILALVGESGCGKTTLGKIVTGLYKPTHGQLFFEGKDVYKMNKEEFDNYRNSVQMVQQDAFAALNPARTIYQSLSAPILQKKLVKNTKEAYERVCELLKIVELTPPEQFLEKYPHQLSGGQRQRVTMARAISLNPKVIVADEPVSMIDVSLRLAMLNLMASLNKSMNIAFIYITHDLSTARYIAQNGRMAVMYLGKIVEQGNVQEILSNPRHPYLQALLTAVPVPNPKIAKMKRKLPLKSLEMPSVANPPKGCRFNPRCPYADKKCEEVEPEMVKLGSGFIACHNYEKVPKWELPKAN